MTFKVNEVSHLLALCHRGCCICHRLCDDDIEIGCIVPEEEGGTNDIENAVLVCPECHAEIDGNNNKHPSDRQYTSEQLKARKEQWLRICQDKTETLLHAFVSSYVGPLQVLIDELEYNLKTAELDRSDFVECRFRGKQFSKVIERGSISILGNELKDSIIEAYVTMGSTNALISTANSLPLELRGDWEHRALKKIDALKPQIGKAKEGLQNFLSQE